MKELAKPTAHAAPMTTGRVRRLSTFLGACLLAGCAAPAGDEASEELGTTKFAQIDPGDKVWSRVTMTLADPASTPLATIYVFNRDIGAFHAGTEYWYVNPQSLSLLGRYALEISAVAESDETIPPDPYYPREQSFTQPQFVSWGDGWSRDPARGGTLYTGPDGMSLRLSASRTGLLDITWSQVIPSKATARNIIPTGKFTSVQESVSVPPGYLGYSIHQSTN